MRASVGGNIGFTQPKGVYVCKRFLGNMLLWAGLRGSRENMRLWGGF